MTHLLIPQDTNTFAQRLGAKQEIWRKKDEQTQMCYRTTVLVSTPDLSECWREERSSVSKNFTEAPLFS